MIVTSERRLRSRVWMPQLAAIETPRGRRQFLQRQDLLDVETIEAITDEVATLARRDIRAAERLAESANWIAARLRDPYAMGRALRASGHVLLTLARHAEAVDHYERAADALRLAGDELEFAITLNAGILPLIYVGRYADAFKWAHRARETFEKHGDTLRLARVDLNVGNILYRQDRFTESLAHYARAFRRFRAHGTPQDVAVVLRNIAVCRISLDQFDRALRTYRRARAYSERHGMWLLVLENDYNIAYVHYLRGEYMRAIELYNATRDECDRFGDDYHRALCDLDQSELYLELNLPEEGAELANRAYAAFQRLRMGYEAAKALTNLGIAAGQEGRAVRAVQLFADAREMFVRERNPVWPALIDLYKGLVLYEEGRTAEAEALAQAALEFFHHSPLQSKAALAELLLARGCLQRGDSERAQRLCQAALVRLEPGTAPALGYQAQVVLGHALEGRSEYEAAFEAYTEAHRRLEGMRSHLRTEELKIAFLKNKLEVYESLFTLLLAGAPTRAAQDRAFEYVEHAKSRSLADLVSFRAHALPSPDTMRSELVEQVRRLREELNWYYHQIDVHQLRPDDRSPQQIQRLVDDAREREGLLMRILHDLRATDGDFSSLQTGGPADLAAIRAAIPDGTTLVEYYEARGLLYACVLTRTRLRIVPLAPAGRVRDRLRLLKFQLSKFRLGPQYVKTYERGLHDATNGHLRALHDDLIAPVARQLRGTHLLIVPHGPLHHLPFHALHDGQRYLIDRFSISYAPSASVYAACATRPLADTAGGSLVLAVPDERAPMILEEARVVASVLPDVRLFVGDEATEERLRELGPSSRFVHIAAHGYFRQDNPMFSSIRLGKSQLTLFDLYRLRLPAELVVLSGCGTGLNVVVGGDETIGLIRGLLYAGASSVVVSLWDVNDRSTAALMREMYAGMAQSPGAPAAALRRAMFAIREEFPHPYHWAAFTLTGRFQSPRAATGNSV